MSLQWQNPNVFWWLIGVAALGLLMFLKARRFPGSFSWHRFLVAMLGLSMGIAGLARPQWGERVMSRQNLKSNVYIAIDISRSMLAEDTSPSRLGFAVAFCQRLLTLLQGARVALFPFAENGYLQMPLTTDLMAIRDMLGALTPSMTTAQGTDLNTSLTTLLKHILRTASSEREEEPLPTQVILLSDGETHTAFGENVAREFRNHRIPVFTIGVGTPNGTTVPLESKWGLTKESMKDKSGKIVLSKLDPKLLKRISQITEGDYFPARLDDVYALKQRLTQNMKYGKLASTFRVEREFYPGLFAIVFALFLLELLLARWEFVIRSLLWAVLINSAIHHSSVWADEEQEWSRQPERHASKLYNDAIDSSKADPTQTMEKLQHALMLSRDPDLRKRMFFNLGNALLKAGDPVQAIQNYQQAIDTHARDSALEAMANERISDNLVLAQRILEQQKKEEQSQQGQGTGEDGSKRGAAGDPSGPRKNYAPQSFTEEQKRKIFDLLSSDEQRILQRLQDEKNRQSTTSMTDRPW